MSLPTTDPTRIDLAVDPLAQRMTGVAYHGGTPFDVPYMSKITENLWQGGCRDGLVLPHHIKHVVSLYPWERYRVAHELDSHMAVRLYDSLDTPDDGQLEALAGWVNVCRRTGPVLVHCQAGLNRSGLVAGLALVLDGTPPADAVALLRSSRSPAVLCNPAFEAALLAWRG